MKDKNLSEQRSQFYAEQGMRFALEHDKTLITLFTAIIAGLIALVVYDKVSFGSGIFFLVAAGCSVLGLGQTLLHMSFSSKTLHLLSLFYAGDESVPDLIEGSKPTLEASQQNMKYAQMVYTSALVYLMLAVLFAGFGLAIELFQYIKVIGLVIALLLLSLIVVATVWRFVKGGTKNKDAPDA